MNNRLLKIRIWIKVVVLAVAAILVLTFLLLNMNAVVEPRVNLLLVTYERPGLLMVLLLTSLVSMAAGLLLRTVINAMRQFRESRFRSATAALRRDVAEMKASLPETVAVSAR